MVKIGDTQAITTHNSFAMPPSSTTNIIKILKFERVKSEPILN